MIRKILFSNEQRRAIRKMQQCKKGICWWKLGEGKTRIALGLFALLQNTRTPTCLLFVTRPIAFQTVQDEIHKLGFDWQVVEFKKGKRNFSYAKPTIVLISHAGLSNWIELSRFPITLICLDEIHYFSNPKSKRSIAAKTLCDRFDAKIGLGGSIMSAQDNTTIWGQTSVLGFNRLLARNLTEYRKRYQHSSLLDFQNGREKVVQFRNKDDAYPKIMASLAGNIDWHMPEGGGRTRITNCQRIHLSNEQRTFIRNLRKEWYIKLEKFNFEIDVESAMSIVCMVSRIGNGYLLRSTNTTVDLVSPKLDWLCERIRDIVQVEQSKAIVWCHFRSDLEYLSRHLPFALLQMSGSKKFDRDAWKTDRYDVVLATEAIGSSFNDFAQVPYAIYFSMSYKWLDLDQSMGRTNRKSSAHSQCHYDFVLAKGTFDEAIYRAATKSGKDERELMRVGVREWIKSIDNEE